jgi:hypothetical protein
MSCCLTIAQCNRSIYAVYRTGKEEDRAREFMRHLLIFKQIEQIFNVIINGVAVNHGGCCCCFSFIIFCLEVIEFVLLFYCLGFVYGVYAQYERDGCRVSSMKLPSELLQLPG